jgi:hypothetical protein
MLSTPCSERIFILLTSVKATLSVDILFGAPGELLAFLTLGMQLQFWTYAPVPCTQERGTATQTIPESNSTMCGAVTNPSKH